MKKIILFSITVIAVLMIVGMMQSVFAQPVLPEGYYYDSEIKMTYKLDNANKTAATYIYGTYSVDGDTEIYTYNSSPANEVLIPATITVNGEAYNVTKIGEYTFAAEKNKRGNSSATSNLTTKTITLPEGITEIEQYAFFMCKTLKSLDIPSTVTTIGNGAFTNCQSMTGIDFADGIGITTIPDTCFKNCYRLGKLDLPQSVVSIQMNAFVNARALAEVKIHSDSVTLTPASDTYGFPAAMGATPPENTGETVKVPTVFYVKTESIKNRLIELAAENVVSSNRTYDVSGIKDGSQIKFFFYPVISSDIAQVVCAGEDVVFNININDKSASLNTVKVLYDGEVVFEEKEILKSEYTAQVKIEAKYVKQGEGTIEIIADDGAEHSLTFSKNITALYAGITELVKTPYLTAGSPVTASFKLCNISKEKKSIIVLYGIYDENNTLLKISAKGKVLNPAQEEPFTISVAVPSNTDVSRLNAELYVWEGSFNFKPLMIE